MLAQAARIILPNWTIWSSKSGTPPPLAADTFQFNLLFSGFKDKFQIGEYFSGSGSFSNDAMGRVYSLSYGVLLGGNDLLLRGPVSFLNPQLQAGPNFTNLGRPDRAAQMTGNISNFINFNPNGGALTVGIGGQIGYSYDFSSGVSAFSASLLPGHSAKCQSFGRSPCSDPLIRGLAGVRTLCPSAESASKWGLDLALGGA